MKKNLTLTIFLLCLTGKTFAFSKNSTERPFQTEGRISVIFDTDMGNDIDDALALDMLFKYADQNRIKLLGILNNKDSDYSTRFLDLFCTWYGYPKTPIGQIKDGVKLNDYVDYSKNVVEMNDTQKLYRYSIKNHSKLPQSHELYRQLLAKQPDNSVVIISVGFSTNLSRLLQSEPDKYSKLNGRELVAKKVKYLSVMGGSFGEKKRAEFNIIHDLPAAKYTFSNWPTGIVLSPFEVGAKVSYPGKSIAEDFNWTPHHPLVDAYKMYRKYPYNRPTWDLTSVYYTVVKENNLLNISKSGTLSVDEKGFTHFEEGEQGKHYVLSIESKNAEKLKSYFVELIKQKPKKHQK
ncbi:nucleoside hydrolase [Pseudopedobacter beijingensis]|uniref:Nucleoside hydrolase n=1 Tax=Pseudopedobacter beijingensis TaxID=1207056 RepID=A0ABW4IBT0_9SPHI